MSEIEIRSLNGHKLIDETARQMIINLPKGEPDWNVKEGEEGYIKNRTHWEDISETEFFPSQEVKFDEDGWAETGNSFTLELFIDSPYEIMWNQQKYVCLAQECFIEGVKCYGFGNTSYLDSDNGIETSEPFCIYFFQDAVNPGFGFSVLMITLENLTSTVVSVSGKASSIHKLDNKYLQFPNDNLINGNGYGSLCGIRNHEDYEMGAFAVSLGERSIASGDSSFAIGESNNASGYGSCAKGIHTTASNTASYSEGQNTIASGRCSHAEGSGTEAIGENQHVQGKLNLPDETLAYIIGNGTGTGIGRSNAHTLDWEGNAWYSGDVYVGSTSGTNRDEGSKKLATEEFVSETLNELRQEILGGEW